MVAQTEKRAIKKGLRMTSYKPCSRNAIESKSVKCEVLHDEDGKGKLEFSLNNHLQNKYFGRTKEFLVGNLHEQHSAFGKFNIPTTFFGQYIGG